MLSLTSPIEMQRPPVLRFGSGTLATLASWVEDNGYKAPFVIADTVNATRLDLLGLGSLACFGDVVPEPDIPNLQQAIQAAKGSDLIIGFGGGSAMDLAKLVAVMTNNSARFEEISGPNRAPKRQVGLVQIPTTAGTGSEVGTRALVTDPKTMSKIATESLQMLADIAIIDPELTMSVPAFVTAATGVDAMAHCVEAYTSKRAHPVIDAYAIQGIELVGKYLKRAVDDGFDTEARTGLSLAAPLRWRLPWACQHNVGACRLLSPGHPPQNRTRHRQCPDLPSHTRCQCRSMSGKNSENMRSPWLFRHAP